jgi:hypothetical protein
VGRFRLQLGASPASEMPHGVTLKKQAALMGQLAEETMAAAVDNDDPEQFAYGMAQSEHAESMADDTFETFEFEPNNWSPMDWDTHCRFQRIHVEWMHDEFGLRGAHLKDKASGNVYSGTPEKTFLAFVVYVKRTLLLLLLLLLLLY